MFIEQQIEQKNETEAHPATRAPRLRISCSLRVHTVRSLHRRAQLEMLMLLVPNSIEHTEANLTSTPNRPRCSLNSEPKNVDIPLSVEMILAEGVR